MTNEQALALYKGQEVHAGQCTRTVGPRGAVTFKHERWRVSGKVQTWKTRPGEFRIPVKHGLHANYAITQHNVSQWHVVYDCPALQQQAAAQSAELHHSA